MVARCFCSMSSASTTSSDRMPARLGDRDPRLRLVLVGIGQQQLRIASRIANSFGVALQVGLFATAQQRHQASTTGLMRADSIGTAGFLSGRSGSAGVSQGSRCSRRWQAVCLGAEVRTSLLAWAGLVGLDRHRGQAAAGQRTWRFGQFGGAAVRPHPHPVHGLAADLPPRIPRGVQAEQGRSWPDGLGIAEAPNARPGGCIGRPRRRPRRRASARPRAWRRRGQARRSWRVPAVALSPIGG